MEIENVYIKAQQQLENRLPFVVYRKPDKNSLHSVFQKNDTLHTISNYHISGFVLAPFEKSAASVLIPYGESECFVTKLDKVNNFENNQQKTSLDVNKVSKRAHLALVTKGIEAIQSGRLKKVVLSRKEEVKSSVKSCLALFQKLVTTYPNAFVYLWYHPKVGTWLGATPETLLEIKNNQLFTMALAGTQPYKKDKQIHWGEKEKEEQQLVTDFIIKTLTDQVGDISRSQTYCYRAGSLLHLRTDINAPIDLEKTNLTRIIRALHPTPAICGLPRSEAMNFILENERYQRLFYTGFLGEVTENKIDGNTAHLFVNLRCMQLQNDIASIYVGGGITKDSDPEKEWEETVRKTDTIKKVLFS